MSVPAVVFHVELPFVAVRFNAAAAVRLRSPAEVDHVEVAPPVSVSAAAEVNDEAAVGVRLTAPAPGAVKFPEVRVKAMAVEEAVVMVAPALYAVCKVGV